MLSSRRPHFSAFGGYLTRGEAEIMGHRPGRGEMIDLLQDCSAQAPWADCTDEATELFENMVASLEAGPWLVSPGGDRHEVGSIRTFLVS